MASRHLPMASDKPASKPKSRLPPWFRTRLPTGEQQRMFNDTKASVKITNYTLFVKRQNAPTSTNVGQAAMLPS